MEYYLAIKKNNAICSNMDGPRDCHTEWSKSDRKGEISYDIPYMQNLKRNYTNEYIYKTETDLENKLRGNQGEVWRGGIVKESGIDMYTLLHLKWITNKGLLYITRELCSVSCGSLDWRGVGREWIHGWVALLSTWNNHKIANWLYSNIKLQVKKNATEWSSQMKTNDKQISQTATNVNIDNSSSSEVVVLETSLRGEEMKTAHRDNS